MVLLLLPVVLLVASLIRALQQDVAFHAVMEDKLIDNALRLEASLFPGEFRQIVRRLGVVGRQHFEVNFVTLLSREFFLVVSRHVVVVLTEKVIIVLKIVIVVLFDLSARGSLLRATSSFGGHNQSNFFV